MDQHPIPQDVTGFQFKLIGTMTVKQFGYVASGVVTAVILYYLPLHSAIAVLLKVILVPLFGVSGVIVAFVPLEGRPIDVMTTNFVKALFSPNQYIYHRQGRRLSFSTISVAKPPVSKKSHEKTATHPSTPTEQHDEKGEKLRALLLSSHEQVKSDIDKKEAAFLNTLSLSPVQPTVSSIKPQEVVHKKIIPAQPAINNLPQQSLANKPTVQPILPSRPALVQNNNQLSENKTDESIMPPKPNPIQQVPSLKQPPILPINSEHKATVLSQQINEIHAQKQQLEQELSHLKTQLATQKTAPAPVTSAQPTQPLQDPLHVRTIPQNVTKKAGLPHVSDSPNVVVGIVKDPRGNILPNILVEVKDKDGNPVRAFKTNQLGQFASATPLSPGTYTIELDDPKKQQRFDVIQIVANNQVLLPIEVISHDAREELRKQLFAN
jgi:hypothetical protein